MTREISQGIPFPSPYRHHDLPLPSQDGRSELVADTITNLQVCGKIIRNRGEKMTEREKECHSIEILLKILEEFDIPVVQATTLKSEIQFSDHNQPLSLKSALNKPQKELVTAPLGILKTAETFAVQAKRHGRPKSKREIGDIREQFTRAASKLLSPEGVGRILATITLNSGQKARWVREGLDCLVEDGQWRLPSKEEEKWWGWLYRQKQKGENVEGWFKDRFVVNLFHANYVMRVRRSELPSKEFDEFLGMIDPLVPDEGELPRIFKEITKTFR